MQVTFSGAVFVMLGISFSLWGKDLSHLGLSTKSGETHMCSKASQGNGKDLGCRFGSDRQPI